ncbi:GntR family transcriptional regulator [Pseudomonas matsuisoli]|nr:GntR family transcriptional regulator [Pseudomonas matsuisoli]
MKKLQTPAQLIEQVYVAILDAICDGTLPPNERITQEGLAEQLGVSRQPILQAFQILKREGFIEESGRKGVIVTPLDPLRLVQLYQVRAALDALAASEAARRVREHGAEPYRAEGEKLIRQGREAAVGENDYRRVQADIAFHQFIYRMSGNPVIGETTAIHWHHIRRVMSAILQSDVRTFDGVWDEHENILLAILAGDEQQAGVRARQHAESAAENLARRLDDEEHASKRKQA